MGLKFDSGTKSDSVQNGPVPGLVSPEKLRREYPEFVTYVTKHDIEHVRTPILSAFYGQNQIPPNTNLTWLKGIDTDEFLNKTYSGKNPIMPRWTRSAPALVTDQEGRALADE